MTDAGKCASFRAGHNIHWVQFNLNARRSDEFIAACILGADQDGVIELLLDDGSTIRKWTHTPERVRSHAVEELQEVWIGPHSLLSFGPGMSGALISICNLQARTACVSADQIEAAVAEQASGSNNDLDTFASRTLAAGGATLQGKNALRALREREK